MIDELRAKFKPQLQALQERAARGDRPTYQDYQRVLDAAMIWWANRGGQWVPSSTMLKMIKGESLAGKRGDVK